MTKVVRARWYVQAFRQLGKGLSEDCSRRVNLSLEREVMGRQVGPLLGNEWVRSTSSSCASR